MNLILPFHIHSKTSVLTFFLFASVSWMCPNEHYWTSAWSSWTLAVNKDRLLTSTLWRKPECNFRSSFIRWLLPAQSRRCSAKVSVGKSQSRYCCCCCRNRGDSRALHSVHHRSSPHSLSVEEGSFKFLAMWKIMLGLPLRTLQSDFFLKKSEKNADSGSKDKETGNKNLEACSMY